MIPNLPLNVLFGRQTGCQVMSLLLGGGWSHHERDGACQRLPAGFLRRQVFAPVRCEAVVLEFTVPLLVQLPLPDHQPFALEPMQRRIQRAVLDLQHLVGGLGEVLGNVVSVRGAELQRAQDEHVERALQKGAFSHRA